MQVTCIITKRIQWMNPSWLHYPLIRKATCSLGDSDILLNPRLLVFILKEKDVKYKFVQSENLLDWSREKKVVGARMRFVQSCTQRKRYIYWSVDKNSSHFMLTIYVLYMFFSSKSWADWKGIYYCQQAEIVGSLLESTAQESWHVAQAGGGMSSMVNR